MIKITNTSEKLIFVNHVMLLPDNSAEFSDENKNNPGINAMVLKKLISIEDIKEPEETVAETVESEDTVEESAPVKRGRRAKATEE